MDHKISPHPSLPKRGTFPPFTKGGDYGFLLRKRGVKRNFSVILLISGVLEFTFSKG
jgi:hypothetical protein